MIIYMTTSIMSKTFTLSTKETSTLVEIIEHVYNGGWEKEFDEDVLNDLYKLFDNNNNK